MYKFLYIIAIIIITGCSSTTKVNDLPVVPEGSVTCVHTHDSTRNFTYMPPIKEYVQTLFEHEVITYEFILISGKTHFLSGVEEANYDCN